MYNFFLIIFIIIDICLVFLIVIQNGTNSEINIPFDSSKGNSLLTSLNKNNSIVLLTTFFAVLFFSISLILCNINYHKNDKSTLLIKNQKLLFNNN